jgi:endonuclease/exonuclease/phosphatase family metal-dependent hydrolase
MHKVRKIQKQVFILIFLLTLQFPCFSQCNNQPNDSVELKILSWNIYMIPRFFIHSGQISRAREIVESLKNENADVVVFQEAFDSRSRRIIREGLKKYFPFESGNPTKNAFYKTNSGVWVISKVPISVVKRIYFKQGSGSDKFASKGALLLEAKKGGSCFQVVATHLQSDLKRKDVRKIRKSQLMQISKELLQPYALKNVPQFVVGDMNTIYSDTLEYNQMIEILNVKRCTFVGEHNFSYDRVKNDIILKSSDRPQLIDYIFCSKKDRNAVVGKMHVKIFRKKWNSFHVDLSDHFAVSGTFMLKQY